MVAAVDGVKMTGIPVKLDRTPGTIETAPPRFGADGRAILKEYGFSDDTIDGLVATGAVAEPSN